MLSAAITTKHSLHVEVKTLPKAPPPRRLSFRIEKECPSVIRKLLLGRVGGNVYESSG